MATQTDDLDEAAGFSLAELADLDVSDIDEVRFESLPAGAYDFEVTDASMVEDPKDGEPRIKITFGLKILECLSTIEPGVDRDSLAGKSHEERFFLFPKKSKEDAAKTIGRVKAFITDMGGDSGGKLGEMIPNIKGHIFRARIVKQKDKNDKSVEYARLKLEPKKAQAASA